MNLNFWIIQTFNGISYGALLFLVGSGLSLIFGVMRIVNLSHGSYFMLGGYVALTVIWTTGSWLLAIPVAALTIALRRPRDGAAVPAIRRASRIVRNALIALGIAVLISLAIGRWTHVLPRSDWLQFFASSRRLPASRVYFLLSRISVIAIEADPLRQVLLTVGFAFLFQQAALDIWTGNNFDINPPAALTQSIEIGGIYLPLYRVFMIVDRRSRSASCCGWRWKRPAWAPRCAPPSTTRRWRAASASTPPASPCSSSRSARSSPRSAA